MDTSTNYSNRSIDLSLLRGVKTDEGITKVSLSVIADKAEIVTGIQKLVQKYTLCFLSLKDAKFDPEKGTDFIPDVLNGSIVSDGILLSVFAFANADAMNYIKQNTPSEAPLDEQLDSAKLLEYYVDKGYLYLKILITSKAGDTVTFVMPTTVVKR